MKRIELTLFGLLWFCAVAWTQQTYFVSPDGSDANAGTQKAPWRTIQKAASTVTAGSTVVIRGGVYQERISVAKSGSRDAFITFENYPDEVVTIDGAGLNGQVMLKIAGQSYLRFKGITVTNNAREDAVGIMVRQGASNIEFVNCNVTKIHFDNRPKAVPDTSKHAYPMLILGEDQACHDIRIENCNFNSCRTGTNAAINIVGNVAGFSVQNCHFNALTNTAILVKGYDKNGLNATSNYPRNGKIFDNQVQYCGSNVFPSAAVTIDGAKDIELTRNRIQRCQYGFEVVCSQPNEETQNIFLHDNIVTRCALAGLTFGSYDYPQTGRVANSRFLSNTFFFNDTTGRSQGSIVFGNCANTQFRSNIVVASGQWLANYYLGSKDLSVDYNVWYSPVGGKFMWGSAVQNTFAAYQKASSQDAHSKLANPLLTPDFHIEAGSPAINAGDPAYLPTDLRDIDYKRRMQLNRIDCGVDEYTVVPTVEPNPDTDVTIEADIENESIVISMPRNGDISIYGPGGVTLWTAEKVKTGTVSYQSWERGTFMVVIQFPSGSSTTRHFSIQ